MHQIKWLNCVAIVYASFVLSSQARATSAVSTYNYFYEAGQTSYTVFQGSTITVNLYLQEVNSVPANPSLLVSEDGLQAAGVDVSFLSGSGLNTLTAAAPNAGTPKIGFDDPSSAGVVNSPTSVTITESTDPVPFGSDLVGVEGTTPVDGISIVLLGTVTIDANSAPGQKTYFTVGVANPAQGSTFTNDNDYDLDNNADPFNPAGSQTLYNSAAATIFSVTTFVPEPAALSLVGFAGVLLRRRRTCAV